MNHEPLKRIIQIVLYFITELLKIGANENLCFPVTYTEKFQVRNWKLFKNSPLEKGDYWRKPSPWEGVVKNVLISNECIIQPPMSPFVKGDYNPLCPP